MVNKDGVNTEKIKYLSKYKNIVREYNQLVERYGFVAESSDNVKAKVITSMPVSHSTTNDKMSDNMCQKEKLENLIQARLDNLYETIVEIEEAIQKIQESIFRTILSLRYVDGKKWENIAVELNYSWKQVHRLHNEALGGIEVPKKR